MPRVYPLVTKYDESETKELQNDEERRSKRK